MNLKKYFLANIVLFVAYYYSGQFGLHINSVSKFATLIWPPSGIALAAILICGYRVSPSIFAGAFLINFHAGANLMSAMGIAFGNTLEAMTGAYLLNRTGVFRKQLDSLKDVVSLIVIGVGPSSLIGATIGIFSLWFFNDNILSEPILAWQTWWAGDAISQMIVAPFILVVAMSYFRKKYKLTQVIEFILMILLLLLACYLIFGKSIGRPFLVFIFIVWSALRFGQLGSVSSVLVVSVVAIWGAAHNFYQVRLTESIFSLYSYFVAISVTGLTLSASLAERERALKSRDEFISIASHELKTPLTSLSLKIEKMLMEVNSNLSSSIAPQKIKESLNTSMRQIERLSAMVDDLLDVSKIETGKMTYSFSEINLSNIVKDVIERSKEDLGKVGCLVKSDVDVDIILKGDGIRIEQVLDNMISNIIKYAPGNPVNFSLKKHNTHVILTVEDFGPGMPTDIQRFIFKRYERGVSTPGINGLGLGLYIVNEIVKAHGGDLKIESEVNLGTKFIINLPV